MRPGINYYLIYWLVSMLCERDNINCRGGMTEKAGNSYSPGTKREF